MGDPKCITLDELMSELEALHRVFSSEIERLDNRVVVLESLTRGMRLPEELDIAGQTYVKKERK